MSNCTPMHIVVVGLMGICVPCLGCETRSPVVPTAPAYPALGAGAPVVRSVEPNKAGTLVPTVVTILGDRFGIDPTVTFGETRAEIVEATATIITVVTPVHAPGTVDIAVTNGDHQTGRLAGGFVYENPPSGVPSVQAISPTLGVTTGGTFVEILGTGFHFGASVILDGAVMRTFPQAGGLGFTTPAHAAGPVDIVVVNPDGELRLPRAFTYAAPGTFDFNGTWKGQADGPPDSVIDISFTIVNNRLVSVSCGPLTVVLSPAALVGGGEFSFSGENGLVLIGRMLSSSTAIGEIHVPPCSPSWYARR